MIAWLTAAQPIGLPGLAALWLGFLAFVVAILVARRRAGVEARGNATRSRRSMLGIVVQGAGVFLVSFGVEHVVLDPLGAMALIEASVVAALMAIVVSVFAWSTHTMGANWSIVARTRGDHVLVTHGPFTYVRHPIYAALFLLMIAIAIGTGHAPRLILAIPIYGVGTWLRISEEERLLRNVFGAPYDAWIARTPRFVPGLF